MSFYKYGITSTSTTASEWYTLVEKQVSAHTRTQLRDMRIKKNGYKDAK